MKHLLAFIFTLFLTFGTLAQESSAPVFEPNLMLPITLEQSDATLFSSTGYTPWIMLDYGRARLVSCTSGIQNQSILHTAIQLELYPFETIEKPTVTTTFDAAETAILYPVTNPLPAGKTKTDTYDGINFFHLIFHLKQNTEPVTINATLSIPNRTPIPFTLSLPAHESYPTNVCAAMIHDLQKVPAPSFGKILANATSLPNDTIALDFTLHKSPASVALQLDNDFSFKLLRTELNDKNVHIEIQPDIVVAPDTLLNVKLLTSVGWFDVPVALSTTSPVSPTSLPIFGFLMGGIFLALFSPFWIFVLNLKTKSKKEFFKQTPKFFLIALFVLWGTTFLYMASMPQTIIYSPVLATMIALLFLTAFLYFKNHPIFSVALITTLMLPKPYMTHALITLAKSSILLQLPVLLFWCLCALLPFVLLFVYKDLFWELRKKNKKHTLKFLALPLVVLGAWVFIGYLIILPTNNRFALDTQPTPAQTTLIVIDKPEGLSAFWRNVFFFAWKPFPQLEKTNRLDIRRATIFSPLAGERTTFPIYVFQNKNGQNLTVTQPLTRHELKNYLDMTDSHAATAN